MRYYLLAGEASGDLHGANLMKALKAEDADASFRYFGGDLMQAEGGDLAKHISQLAFMGFVEVVANLRTIFRNMKFAKEDILAFQPDALILIDFPGFNLKIAEFAKARGIKVFYYISPKVWAWNQKRVLKIKKVVDRMFCILPFEVDFYRDWGMEVDYIGNPLLDSVAAFSPDEEFLAIHKLHDKPLIALLPGSRKQEISRLLPDMAKVASRFSEYTFVIAGAPNFNEGYYSQFLNGNRIPVLFNQTYNLLHHASAAIVASGTATLETALFRVPEVVVYKGNPVSIAIARALVKIRFISLVNLIMDKAVVKELIQIDCNPTEISAELNLLLNDKTYRSNMLQDYRLLREKMGEPGASQKAAKLMYRYAGN